LYVQWVEVRGDCSFCDIGGIVNLSSAIHVHAYTNNWDYINNVTRNVAAQPNVIVLVATVNIMDIPLE